VVSSLIRDLADEVLAVWRSAPIQARRRMWARHIRGEKVEKVPVIVFLIWGDRALWDEVMPAEVASTDPLAASIEYQLKQKLWKWRSIPDDDLIRPWVALTLPRPPDMGPLWGIELPQERTAERGSSRPMPVIAGPADLRRLAQPRFRWDEAKRAELVARARELLDDKLPIFFEASEMGESPFEHARRMCGMEALFLGVLDRPEFVHAVMEFVTEGTVAYHREREAAGFVSAEESWRRCKVRWDEVPDRRTAGSSPTGAQPGKGLKPLGLGARQPDAGAAGEEGQGRGGLRLKDVWAYVSAQSAAPLSPKQYEEFIQPYHERVAEIFGKVYYHGCEDLTAKMDIIARLPNLRRFHVSPWTDLAVAARKLGRQFIIEKHLHSPNVLFAFTPGEMREELRQALDVGRDLVMEIHLSDITTVEGDRERLIRWAAVAQEEAERARGWAVSSSAVSGQAVSGRVVGGEAGSDRADSRGVGGGRAAGAHRDGDGGLR
jgi:hypothetical protein